MDLSKHRRAILKGIQTGLCLMLALLVFTMTYIDPYSLGSMIVRPEETFSACPTLPGRLGNHIYHYASVYGLAKTYNLTIILGEDDDITQYFKVPSATIHKDRSICKRFELKQARYCCRFDESLLNLERKSYRFGKYLQSWKYFRDVFDGVRSELEFRDRIQNYANRIVQDFRNEYMLKHSVENVVVVGIHVRRGDIVEKKFLRADISIPDGYVYRAMDYFLMKYSYTNVIFVVCSEGSDYVKPIISYKNVTALYVSATPIKDIAVLAACDHVIMTYGTFGWWAGFLSKGEVVYYKYPITEGSALLESYNYDEFFPSHWTGLD